MTLAAVVLPESHSAGGWLGKLARGFDEAVTHLLAALEGAAEVLEDDEGRVGECGRRGEEGADTWDVDARGWGVAKDVLTGQVVREEFPFCVFCCGPRVQGGGQSVGWVDGEALC